ncbi:MAG TPA: 16S rRNA (guanine(966)-N(2))-methyltransferase RsmD [Acidobacteriaceae bacterium]|nr:16S rRNA (guanine(966)-N(2))-methyltransferase RsmD [Acidobacteriaceae bacterium]
MRVIAGEFRSRPLVAPKGLDTRPTSDRLRETLFNVLAPRTAGSIFLDLYAGSGAIGVEALSRGASHVIFVEHAPPALRAIRTNLASLGIRGNYSIESHRVSAALRRLVTADRKADIVFLDPPYNDAEEYDSTLALLGGECLPLLAPHAIVIAECLRKLNLPDTSGALHRYRILKQGDSILSFYSVSSVEERS